MLRLCDLVSGCQRFGGTSYLFHLDFTLWWYATDRVYISSLLETLAELKEHIPEAKESLNVDMLRTSYHDYQYRLDVCHATISDHVEHL
jgi:hypothetical protein